MKSSAKMIAFACAGSAWLAGGVAYGQNGGDETMLFSRPAAQAPGAPDAGDVELNSLQLAGISTLGGTSMFNLVDARTNRSFWVPLNEKVNGFAVVSYDERSDTVVVDRNGQRRAVPMRQAQIAAMPAASVVPAATHVPVRPPAGMPTQVVHTADGGEIVNPKTPQEIAQAETEARMMVSDLLEISMQERARQKALREAQRQQRQQQRQPAPQGQAQAGP